MNVKGNAILFNHFNLFFKKISEIMKLSI